LHTNTYLNMMKNLASSRILLPQFLYRTLKALALTLVLLSGPVSAFADNPVPGAGKSHVAAFAATITSFAPASGPIGTVITVKGTALSGVNQMMIGGRAAIITAITDTTVAGMVMPGASSGSVSITAGSMLTATGIFTITATVLPVINSTEKIVEPSPSLKNVGYACAVSADGSTAAVTAYSKNNAESGVKFYKNVAGIWTAASDFIKPGFLEANSGFGYSVALSGDGSLAVIGSLGDNVVPDVSFGAYVFKRSAGFWSNTSATKLEMPASSVGISTDGNTIVTGTIAAVKVHIHRGTFAYLPADEVNLYHRSGANDWVRTPMPINTESSSLSLSGHYVAISADATTVFTSAGTQGFVTETKVSHIDIWTRSSGTSNDWYLSGTLANDIYNTGNYHVSMSADGGFIAIAEGYSVSVVNKAGGHYDFYDGLQNVYEPDFIDLAGPVAFSADGSVLAVGNKGTTLYARENGVYVLKGTAGQNFTSVGLGMSANAKVVVYSNTGESALYLQLPPPVPAPSGYANTLTFTNTTTTSTTLSWVKGNGGLRAVFIGVKGTAAPLPADFTTYNANAAYGSGKPLGTAGWYCVYNGDGASVNISNLLAGTTYRAEVIEYNGNNGSESYLTTRFAPADVTTLNPAVAVQASAITFAGTTGTTTTVNWANGNGTGRVVFINKTNSGAPLPANVYYSPNNRYTSGNQIGTTGWYCIYNGTGTTVNVVGLASAQTYRVAVVEYSGTIAAPKYLATGIVPANVSTPIEAPSGYSTALAFSNTTSTSSTLSWTNGNGAARAVFIKLGTSGGFTPQDGIGYAPNNPYTQGFAISDGWYCVYRGTGNSVNLLGLSPVSTYRVAVVDYNGSGNTGSVAYGKRFNSENVTTLAAPNVQATPPSGYAISLAFSNTAPTSTTLSWVNSNGAARAVFVRIGTSGALGVTQGTTYTASSTFAAGTQAGSSGWFCVYNGTGNSVNIVGLNQLTTYRATVIEYNGKPGLEGYNLSRYNGANVTTIAVPVPSVAASQITYRNILPTLDQLYWTRGNGALRSVFIKVGATGAPVPSNGYLYTAGDPFAPLTAGTPIHQDVPNADWYCVYTGADNALFLRNLLPSTTYRVAVVDFNGGTGGMPTAFVKNFNVLDFTTPGAPPTDPATNVTFSNATATTATLSWVNGNGTARAVFLSAAHASASNLIQGTTYTANSIFGLGSTQEGVDGLYCVYNGTGSTVNISGLQASTEYHVIVVEYNGSPGQERYPAMMGGTYGTTGPAPGLLLTTNQKRLLVQQDVLADNTTTGLNVHQGVSPNGDGVNDVFTIDGIGAYPENTVKVINNNGEVIYSATGYNNYSKAFDGRAANGTLQKAGTYFYSLEYKKGAEVIRKTGYLILKF
jgi:gliding motility-associated-like protein